MVRKSIFIGFLMILGTSAFAEKLHYKIIIKDAKFEPAEIKVPAGKPFKLTVHNQGKTEEFESNSLKIEKLLAKNQSVTINLGPLKPGSYDIFGEFRMDTCQGKIIAE